MKKQKSFKIELIVSVLIILLAIGGVFLARGGFSNNKNTTQAGQNNVEVNVVNEKEDYDKTYSFETEEKTLGDLLDKEKLVEYQDSDYGRYITGVDGMKADDSKQLWWSVEVNGESSQTGVDGIEIKDGDKYTLRMMEGY
ncbi:MAG TPA: hypothetical protein DCW90_10095 [Lachnospiraceae bacterium]|nr:DUF4430 domain-containing protein [uncultured Lachnoclostridium sp.]HAU85830.1 hypothetical protein [Lachnospiraceae bacterium]